MGTFITAKTALPTAKVDKRRPKGTPSELSAADINALWAALGDVRDHVQGWFNVQAAGALGNGTLDDTVALVLANVGTSEKVVPRGTYRVATNITLSGVWRFDVGAVLKPDSGRVIAFDSSALIIASGPWIDTSAGGSASYQAGSSQSMRGLGKASQTRAVVQGFAGNVIASDLGTSLIAGGGNAGSEQYIGYNESLDRITGDGVTTSFTTSFNASPTQVFVQLIRADQVRVDVTASAGLTQSGSKVQVVYPQAAHFVNDGTGGTEGTNAALLATQKLFVSSKVKILNIGSACDYSSILDGYDNVISAGIRQTASGAHQRITGGDHNTIFGGSYNRITSGTYGLLAGGSANEIAASGSGNVLLGFGNLSSGTGPCFGIGSSLNLSGAFAFAAGTGHTLTSANGSAVLGRLHTVSAADTLVAGNGHTVSSVYSATCGFTHAVSGGGYSATFGRQHTNSGAYTLAVGRGNSVTADHSMASGKDASVPLAFAQTIGGEQIAALGDAQSSVIVARRQTANATPTELRLGAATARLTIPSNTTWVFSILVTARQTSAAAGSAGWKLEGVLRNDAATVSLVGAVTKTALGKDASAAAWDIAATADNTNKALAVTATGAAATVINWVARIELSEVSG